MNILCALTLMIGLHVTTAERLIDPCSGTYQANVQNDDRDAGRMLMNALISTATLDSSRFWEAAKEIVSRACGWLTQLYLNLQPDYWLAAEPVVPKLPK